MENKWRFFEGLYGNIRKIYFKFHIINFKSLHLEKLSWIIAKWIQELNFENVLLLKSATGIYRSLKKNLSTRKMKCIEME